jgi:hypothetical protein
LRGLQIGGAYIVGQVLQTSPAVVGLDFSRNAIKAAGVKSIALALQASPQITALDISENKVCLDHHGLAKTFGFVQLCRRMKNHQSLAHLTISKNALSGIFPDLDETPIVEFGNALKLQNCLIVTLECVLKLLHAHQLG